LFDGGIGYADRRIEAASAITSESARILTPIFGVFDPLSRPTLDSGFTPADRHMLYVMALSTGFGHQNSHLSSLRVCCCSKTRPP
jgi:hypothetical protein